MFIENRRYSSRTIMRFVSTVALVFGISTVLILDPAFADPPDWAPAHGYRAKHKNKHKGKHKSYESQPWFDTKDIFVNPDSKQPRAGDGSSKDTTLKAQKSAEEIAAQKARDADRSNTKGLSKEEIRRRMKETGSIYEGAKDKGAR